MKSDKGHSCTYTSINSIMEGGWGGGENKGSNNIKKFVPICKFQS